MDVHLSPRESVVAVIDDDTAVLNSIEFLLSVQGHAVLAFPSAAQALADPRIDQARFLIVDWKLPDMDGLTLLERLRSRQITAPAILIASMPTGFCRRRAAELGAPVVEKPLTGEAIGKWLAWLSPERSKARHQRKGDRS